MERIKELGYFYLITISLTWAFWLPALLAGQGVIGQARWMDGMQILGPFGPAVAAFWLVFREKGRQGIKSLWKRGWTLPDGKHWLLVSLFLLPVIALLTLLGLYLAGIAVPWEYGLPPVMAGPVFLIIYFLNALPEEYGWRGYALARLQSRWTALTASLVLGVLWALWHLPLHFMAGTVQENIPIPEYAVHTVALTFLYTWLYNSTNGNLLVVNLFHASGNITAALIPFWVTSQGRWVNFLILLLVAIVVVSRGRHPGRVIIFPDRDLAR